MSQLIKEIRGKYYQECEVVMLASKKPSLLYIQEDETLYFNISNTKMHLSEHFKPQHFYIVSNEEIKEGDWVVYENEVIYQNNYGKIGSVIGDEDFIRKYCKKIIATTDESIGYTDIRVSPVKNFCTYPQPSDSFIKNYIKEYNKGILVEYSKHLSEPLHEILKSSKPLTHSYSLKVDSNNTITIKKLESELYTREQLENHIRNAMRFKGYTSEYEVQEYCKKYLN